MMENDEAIISIGGGVKWNDTKVYQKIRRFILRKIGPLMTLYITCAQMSFKQLGIL